MSGRVRVVRTGPDGFCAVAPSPQLRERLREGLRSAQAGTDAPLALAGDPRPLGFDDGMILPPDAFPPGTPLSAVRSAAADRAPLRGKVRVVVVLVEFSDRPFGQPASRFEELFFSTGTVPTGSVTEYFADVTGGLVEIVGEVVGPFTMPQPLAWYANGNYGIGKPSGEPRANILARDAAVAANATVDFGPYDNDGNGYVDAFIMVHAGGGGEETGDPGDIWSHKWVLPEEYDADGTKIFAYLTIPEDAKLGVSAHELGHLVFGYPDLYDIDYTSEGIGDWCLMAGGSWNGGGDTPAHPSAWCKAQQEWVDVQAVTQDTTVTLQDVKTSRTVHRLWTDGVAGPEYFLLEYRRRAGFDAELPGEGLLVWHVDETQPTNADENHYLVALMQADGSRDLENDANRGDGGDPYPGWSGNTAFTATTTPASTGYSGADSLVAVTDIAEGEDGVQVTLSVHAVPGGGGGEDGALQRRVEELEGRVAALEEAVAGAGQALLGWGAGAGERGAAGGRRRGPRADWPGTGRPHGGHAGRGDGDGRHRDGGRGDGAADALNAGLAAAAKAARDLMSEVQHQWSPRRRT